MSEVKSLSRVGEDKPAPKIEQYLRSPAFHEEAAKLLGSSRMVERMARCAITCIYTAPDRTKQALLACRPETLVQVILGLAEIGLEPGRDAYLIPRKGTVCASIRWEGYVRAARASGEIRKVWGSVIRDGDTYEIEAGSAGNSVMHSWKLGAKRGEILGAYACAEWKDGTVETLVVDRDYLDRCRRSSESGSGPWDLWPDQMSVAKVVKLLCKRLPLGLPEKPETSMMLEQLDSDRTLDGTGFAPDAIEEQPAALPPPPPPPPDKTTRKPRQPKPPADPAPPADGAVVVESGGPPAEPGIPTPAELAQLATTRGVKLPDLLFLLYRTGFIDENVARIQQLPQTARTEAAKLLEAENAALVVEAKVAEYEAADAAEGGDAQ